MKGYGFTVKVVSAEATRGELDWLRETSNTITIDRSFELIKVISKSTLHVVNCT